MPSASAPRPSTNSWRARLSAEASCVPSSAGVARASVTIAEPSGSKTGKYKTSGTPAATTAAMTSATSLPSGSATSKARLVPPSASNAPTNASPRSCVYSKSDCQMTADAAAPSALTNAAMVTP